MPCDIAYATAYDFAVFWCLQVPYVGFDDSGGTGNAFLTDTLANFTMPSGDPGIPIQVGMPIYNATKLTYGKVTGVAATILNTTNAWDTTNEYRLMPISAAEVATIEQFLDIAANDLFAAMAATGMCDCTLASWAAGYLKKLNLIDAMVIHNCPCGNPNLTNEQKQMWLNWVTEQLNHIRLGEIELCQGETSVDYPALAWAKSGLTEWTRAQIFVDED